MGILVPVIIIALGLASQILVEAAADLSTQVLLETETGVGFTVPRIVSDSIVDLRPETSLNTLAEPGVLQPGS